jgi:hypothetical protein
MANLANPTIIVDDETVSFKASSLSYKEGLGDAKVRTQQSGNGVTTVVTVDSETKISMVKFTMILTQDSDSLTRSWAAKRETGGCTIEFFDGMRKSFVEMILITDPEKMTGAEGEVEVEFNGPPGG